MAKRFITPFAEAGDRAEISNVPAGSDVNMQTGYPAEYEADPVSDPNARFVERDKTNQIFNDITANIKEWQENTYPEFITAANNGGTAFAYKKGDRVRYNGDNYESLEDANEDIPTTSKWVDVRGLIIPAFKFKDEALAYDYTGVSDGTRVEWQGYYAQSDGGGNWGVLRRGSHTDDGGSIFSIDANTYIEANITEAPVSILLFGGRDDGATNNTDKIRSALKFAYNNLGGWLEFPAINTGEYLLDPLSFEGYSSITLTGTGGNIDPNYFFSLNVTNGTKYTKFTFVSPGDVGLQFSSTQNSDVIGWTAGACKVENIWVNGNNLVRTCINGNFGITLNRIQASGAIEDGVTLESYSYPALIENSQLGPNGRNGLLVRGPYSTVIQLRRITSSLNGGYGYVFEGGSGVSVDDCNAQDNRVGGLKIIRRNDLYNIYSNYFLENFTFNRFYSELNGNIKLGDVDYGNYEGNYALVIDGDGTHPSGVNEAREITFNEGALNASADGSSYNIETVYGLYLNGVSVEHNKGRIGTGYLAGMEERAKPTSSFPPAPFPFHSSYLQDSLGTSMKVENGGVVGNRGRVQYIPFFSTLSAGGFGSMTTELQSVSGVGLASIPISKGSILGIKAFCEESSILSASNTGTVTLSITQAGISDEGAGQSYMPGQYAALSLDMAQGRYAEKWFEPLEVEVSDKFIGVYYEASADYSNRVPSILVYLIVEM